MDRPSVPEAKSPDANFYSFDINCIDMDSYSPAFSESLIQICVVANKYKN